MSRPQFPVNGSPHGTSHVPGPIVNGGLIDFQDNYHRGANDYAQFLAAQQQQGMGGLPSMYTSTNFASPQQQLQSVMQSGMPVPGLPSHSSALVGPPAYLTVAGKVYKPVEDSPASVVSEPKRPATETVVVEQRPISDEDVDRRVAIKLNEWMSAQRPKSARSGGVKGRGVSDEERAASRVKNVNACMPRGGRYYMSPA